MARPILVAAAVAVCLALCCTAFAQCPTDDGAIIARYQLDELEGLVAHDDVGGHDGTLVNGPVWDPDGGDLCGGGALLLDGLDDYVDLPTGAWDDFGPDESFCVSCCFCAPAVLPGQPHIIGRYHPSYDGGMMSILYGVDFETGPDYPGHVAFSFRTDHGGAATYVVSTEVYAPGVWHSVCAVRDRTNDEFRLYVDGELAAPPHPDTFPGDQGLTQSHFVIGRCGESGQGYFEGEVDRVVIWRGLGPCPAEPASWGAVKALYR
ncbi:MAG: LamG domain-containing protein [Planctomycetes bacterium]|nr:LamG domain-containing protein [Planctomycetota bacterium]